MSRKLARSNPVTADISSEKFPLDFGGLSDLIGYHLRRAQGATHRGFLASVAELKLTQKQTAVLWLVAYNPGVAQGALGSALAMDRATMMALVDRMEDRRLIRRARSRVDARRRELHATPTGHKLLENVRKRIAVHELRLKALYSPGELRQLLELLQRLQDLDNESAHD